MNKLSMIVVCGLLVISTTSTFAQKSKIREANRTYEKAVEEIIKITASTSDPEAFNDEKVTAPLLKAKAAAEEATTNAETSNNADAWYAKATVLIEMGRVPQFKSQRPAVEGMKAMEKAYELSPKIVSKDGIENSLFNAGVYALNAGILDDLNNENYDQMLESVSSAKKAFSFNNSQMFKDKAPTRDTLISTSDYYIGYAQYLKKDYPKAIAQLESNLKSPIGQSNVDAYRILAFSYSETKDIAKQIATIEAGLKKFPGNKDLEIDELNYYISQNKQSELVGKFEDAVAREPNNAQYIHNLGILYRNMGMEKEGKFPADAADWHKKSEAQLKKAIGLDPKNATFNFNLSSLYVVKADLIGNQMNSLGSSKADNQKYDELVDVRKALLKEAIAPLLVVEKELDPKIKSGKISSEERGYLLEGLQSLGRLYGAIDDAANAKKYREKLRNYEDGNFN